ncbi:MAG: hypothetical protein DRR06_09240 [Gammaproteobacteria bacterium]|nr:MAG: hypothetical protein DRR06_09240 [Gammaproteobacteria bacterium]
MTVVAHNGIEKKCNGKNGCDRVLYLTEFNVSSPLKEGYSYRYSTLCKDCTKKLWKGRYRAKQLSRKNICEQCGKTKRSSYFAKVKNVIAHNKICKKCHSENLKKANIVVYSAKVIESLKTSTKICISCNEEKLNIAFLSMAPTERGFFCKECKVKEKSEYDKKYRKDGRKKPEAPEVIKARLARNQLNPEMRKRRLKYNKERFKAPAFRKRELERSNVAFESLTDSSVKKALVSRSAGSFGGASIVSARNITTELVAIARLQMLLSRLRNGGKKLSKLDYWVDYHNNIKLKGSLDEKLKNRLLSTIEIAREAPSAPQVLVVYKLASSYVMLKIGTLSKEIN